MRYDVKVVMTHEYTLAIEANDPITAQAEAMAQVATRSPERIEMEINVEQGTR